MGAREDTGQEQEGEEPEPKGDDEPHEPQMDK